MLPKISIDDTNFERLMQEYRGMIPGIYEGWTNFNYSDPGITLLELFAWLKENQMYFLDRVTAADREALAGLLGQTAQHVRPARAFVIAKAEKRIRKGTAFYAGALCFEAEKTSEQDVPEIVSLQDSAGNAVEINADRKFGEMRCLPFGNAPAIGNTFSIRLDGALQAGRAYRLFVSVAERTEALRNPILEEGYLGVAEIAAWNGTERLDIRDETHGFTQSGTISFTPKYSAERTGADGEAGYDLRISLQDGGYEIPPVLSGLSFRMISLKQQETLAAYTEEKIARGADGRYNAETEEQIFARGAAEAFLSVGNGMFRRAGQTVRVIGADGSVRISFADAEAAGRDAEREKRQEEGPLDAGGACNAQTEVLIAAASPAFLRVRVLGEAMGCDRQRFSLPYGPVIPESLAILCHDARTDGYELWRETKRLFAAGKNEAVFAYDAARNEVVFGDGIHGKMPEGELILIGMALCEGAGGNIAANLIRVCEDESVRVIRQEAAEGGQSALTAAERQQKVRGEEALPLRAVTEEDYRRLVMKTPGLLPEAVKVLPGFACSGEPSGAANEVGIVVKPYTAAPWSAGGHAFFERAYRANILRFLEPRRMINTKITVLEARPVPVSVAVEAEAALDAESCERALRREIERFFAEKSRNFGTVLKQAELFARLCACREAGRVRWLSMEVYGADAKRLPQGDIRLPADGSAALGEIRCNVRNR